MATQLGSSNQITLKGSTKIVSEFFWFSINSILYQRGIYESEKFVKVKKYGLPMQVADDPELKQFLHSVLKQFSQWLLQGVVDKLVLVITGVESKQVLERWVFNIEADSSKENGEKPMAEITKEIQALIRQITGSVTFLPLIEETCAFDILIYTDKNLPVPQAWEESDAKMIDHAQSVKLRSFSTLVHEVDGMVSYRLGEW